MLLALSVGAAFMLFIVMLVLFLSFGSLLAVNAIKRRKAKEEAALHSTN